MHDAASKFIAEVDALDARWALETQTAKPKRKATPKNSARAMHKRKADGKTTAVVDCSRLADGELVVCVSDVLTKNDRYRKTRYGQCESALAKAYKAAVLTAAIRAGFIAPVKVRTGKKSRPTRMVYSERTIASGMWEIEVLSVWPRQRHHDCGLKTANGDSDAPLAMAKDALKHAGIIDDDMRIISDKTHSMYSKGERRTVIALRRIDGNADAVTSMLHREAKALATSSAAC